MAEQTSTAHVLLVEDSALTRRIFKTALEPEGFHVLEAISVDTALNEAQRVRPDIVLIDFVLDGEQDGADLACALKDIPELSDVPLVAITSVEAVDMREKIRHAPFDLVMSKPVSVPALVATVIEMVERTVTSS